MDRGLQNGLLIHYRDTDLLLTTGLSHTKNCQRYFGKRLTKALPQLWGLLKEIKKMPNKINSLLRVTGVVKTK